MTLVVFTVLMSDVAHVPWHSEGLGCQPKQQDSVGNTMAIGPFKRQFLAERIFFYLADGERERERERHHSFSLLHRGRFSCQNETSQREW